jgi:hypothetical protein
LAAIGPYTLVRDTLDLWLATWDAPPGLKSPLGHFGLEFRVEGGGDDSPLRPDAKVFNLLKAWKARHAAFAATMMAGVEERTRQAGVTGTPSDVVTGLAVSISRADDVYTASATVGLAFDGEHGQAYQMDVDTGEFSFWG